MKSRVGITLGDPAGIGPEVTLKAVYDREVQSVCTPVLIGDKEWLNIVSRQIGKPDVFSFEDFHDQWVEKPGRVALFPLEGSAQGVPTGKVSRQGGEAAAKYIRAGVALALEKKIESLVTAPISKASLNLSGLPFPGHTEFLASLTGSADVAMMFYSEPLKVALLTTHLSLREAVEEVRKDKIIEKAKRISSSYEKLVGEKPRIAVCGLNPHAGEQGLFGEEEDKEIVPAIEDLRGEDIGISGPFPADTIFSRVMKKKEFDLVLCLYHDQGLIAMKSLNLRSVNITLGLPFVRTCPDHGTAFDIAGRNLADPSGMIQAILVAAKFSRSP